MKNKILLLIALLVFAPLTQAAETNRSNANGKRIGHWVLDANNKPTISKSKKASEGKYLNGRKEGVWIFYYEDGRTPRLIGEYSDNRPSGSYFRFTEKGKLKQASAVARKLNSTNKVTSKNKIFNCELNFENKEIVAGQVFFAKNIIKNNELKFWVDESFECQQSSAGAPDFSWLNDNYTAIRKSYFDSRTPGNKTIKVSDNWTTSVVSGSNVRLSPEQNLAKQGNYYHAPTVQKPRLAKGMVFQAFGINKLYTKNNEIWIDGFFKNGQLQDGKVFIYDRDGVLLKVRVYKDGVYESDGVL